MGPYGDFRGDSLVTTSDADSQDLTRSLELTALRAAMSEFASHVANRLFLVGLRLDSARSILGNSPAGDRIAAAADEIDQLISDVRATIVNSAATDS